MTDQSSISSQGSVLITGATGFLGSHLVQELVNQKYTVIALARQTSNRWRIAHLEDKITLFIMDGEAAIEKLFANHNISAIIHTATDYGREGLLAPVIETNLLFPVKLIETGLKYGLAYFLNTDTYFGKSGYHLSYLKNYIHSKRLLNGYLLELSSRLKIANLRLEHIYGERDAEHKFVTSIIKQLIQQKAEIQLTEGEQKRDFIYVDDVVHAYIKVLECYSGCSSYTDYEVGTGQSVTVKNFVISLTRIIQSKSKLNFGALQTRDGEIADSVANNKTLLDIGWQCQYNLDKAMQKILKDERMDSSAACA